MGALQTGIDNMDPTLKTIVELGVSTGYTIQYIKETVGEDYKIYGFDSFKGLPEDWKYTTLKRGFFYLGGKPPKIPGINFVVGWFQDTLPGWVKEHPEQLALLHVDCDLYSSAIFSLETMMPVLGKNTILVFDEWIYDGVPNDQHEQKAFYEWVAKHNIKYEFIDHPHDIINDHERKVVRLL